VRDRTVDRTVPDEAEVCAARSDRRVGVRLAVDAGPVDVQLVRAEAVHVALAARDQLGAEHVGVEGVRPVPVGDGDDAVIERCHVS
jgi:hypothetical protein